MIYTNGSDRRCPDRVHSTRLDTRDGQSCLVRFDQHATLWEAERSQCMCESVVGMFPWQVSVVGNKGPNYGRFDIVNHRFPKEGVEP